MSTPTSVESVCFFSPSYRNDLNRLIILRRSILKHCKNPPPHVVAVPNADIKSFTRALTANGVEHRCEVIAQEDIVDRKFFPRNSYKILAKLAPSQKWRFREISGKSGWTIQQIAKLNSPKACNAATIVALDSDVVFFRPFDCAIFVPTGAPLLVRREPEEESAKHRKHIENARLFLSLSSGSTEHHYMSCPAVLQSDWLKELHSFIESKYREDWQTALFRQESISEYSIYGTFVQEILKPRNITIRNKPFNLILWDESSFNKFFENPDDAVRSAPDQMCVTVQSNLEINPESYQEKLRHLLF